MSKRAERAMPITTLRAQLAEAVTEVRFRGARIVLEKHGHPVAALVSVADLERLHALEDGVVVPSEAAATPEAPPKNLFRRRTFKDLSR